jgi:hypothetical protein
MLGFHIAAAEVYIVFGALKLQLSIGYQTWIKLR